MRIGLAVLCCLLAVRALIFPAGRVGSQTPQYPPTHDVALSRLFPPEALARLLLPPDSWHPFPRASEREAWQALHERIRTRILRLAENAAAKPLQVIPASIYLDFARNGNRSRYEAMVKERRGRLHALVLGECVEAKGRFLDAIADTLWATSEESTWCYPAHVSVQKAGVGLPDTEEPIVDLFAAQAANSIVWTDYLLGDRLESVSPLLRPRLAREVRRRVLEPYRMRDDFSWMGLSGHPNRRRPNNWNPWINSNVLATILLLEKDLSACTTLVHKVLRSLDAYLVPYPTDGSCDEGPGYWHVAGASLFNNLELLSSASNGRISVFNRPVIAEIGRFIVRAHIAGDYYVAIGDAPARQQLERGLVFRFGRLVGDKPMQDLSSAGVRWDDFDPGGGSLERTLRSLFVWKDLVAARSATLPLFRDVWLPNEDMQMMAARDRAGSDRGFYLAAWGGHNAQSHNHNDVGNFLVFVEGQPVLVDPGRPEYTRRTFSSQRYEIWAMQSAYHNVPTVKGVMQADGRRFAAREVGYSSSEDAAELKMDIAAAYPASAGLKKWVRRARLDRGKSIVIEESAVFSGEPGAVVLNLMTPCEVDVRTPGTVGFKIAGTSAMTTRSVLLDYDPAKFTALVEPVPLDDASLRQMWNNRLHRVQLRFERPGIRESWMLRITRPAP